MGECEQAECDFCKEIKVVERTYLRPSKFIPPRNFWEYDKLYNQGDYFIIIRTCSDCGVPKTN
jgi:hypothetical protein